MKTPDPDDPLPYRVEGQQLLCADETPVMEGLGFPMTLEFMALACNNYHDLIEACRRLLRFNEELCQNVRISTHYPSADFARKVLARVEGHV